MIILYSLQKLNGERTISSIFHLLHGKQSSQTIQDAFLYRLTPFFNTFPYLSRQELAEMIAFFKTNEWIGSTSDDHYLLTEKGKNALNGFLIEKPIPLYLDGMNMQKQSLTFWERLSLLVQVISYLQKRDSKYIPIQRNPETIHCIRTFLKQNRYNRERLGLSLYNELVSCLVKGQSINPNFLVVRLSGYHSIGLTLEQAAQKFNLETTQFYYEFLNILHFMVTEIQHKPETYPILSALIEPSQGRVLTQSAEKTLELLQRGYSQSEIVKIRQLKEGTIEDHIVELALKITNFSIEPYITKEKQAKIKTAVSKSQSKQLKVILNMVKDATYFEIRLVLAKYGDG